MIKLYIINTAKWHHQTHSSRYNILSTKHQLRRQVFKNILAMHRKQMRFHKTKLVDETEDLKEECCEFRKEVCFESYTMFGSLFT